MSPRRGGDVGDGGIPGEQNPAESGEGKQEARLGGSKLEVGA